MMERSCGAVLYTISEGVPYYVLVLGSVYGFPKGHVEEGETETETAEREIFEETGVRVKVDTRFRHEITYPLPSRNNVLKTVTFFIAEYDCSVTPKPSNEIKNIAVVPFEKAEKLLPHPPLKAVLRAARDYIDANRKI